VPIPLNKTARWAGGMVQVLEYLSVKHEARSSKPQYCKNKKINKRKTARSHFYQGI
jgi:hypothetical protein